jgi:hypothetical protein
MQALWWKRGFRGTEMHFGNSRELPHDPRKAGDVVKEPSAVGFVSETGEAFQAIEDGKGETKTMFDR